MFGGILTADAIKKAIAKKEIVIEPYVEARLNPNSYDLRLNLTKLKVARENVLLDSKESVEDLFEQVPLDDNGTSVVLQPNRLYLGCSVEYTETLSYVPIVIGRSSLARLGVSITHNAGFGDIGYRGNWTLAITCTNPVRIYHSQKVAQIYYLKPHGKILRLYHGKYQNAIGTLLSRSLLDFVWKK